MATRVPSPTRARSDAQNAGRAATPRLSGSRNSASPRTNVRHGSSPQPPAALRVIGGFFSGTARLLGRGVRAIGGQAKSIDPLLLRDGAGLALLVAAIITGATFWFDMAGKLGEWLTIGLGTVFGIGAYAIPVLFMLMAVRTMRDPIANGPLARQVVGWMALSLGVLGIINLMSSPLPAPSDVVAMRAAGGFIGYLSSSMLVQLLPKLVAGIVLFAVALFGLLVVIGRPVSQHVANVRT
ncbi:MAG: DNA translocase FtsK 4TM domain-containing protein, partial [Propionibacteriaceae bacterium]|nr:DNA translocase FtsK 4TM domain-containing protein [Propionibacteriaceae bacterium]